ncbi:hypothetical protein EJB05_38543, partial [Eragrostis curvula]
MNQDSKCSNKPLIQTEAASGRNSPYPHDGTRDERGTHGKTLVAAVHGSRDTHRPRKEKPATSSSRGTQCETAGSMATTASSFLSPAKLAPRQFASGARTPRRVVRFPPARAEVKEAEAEASLPPPQAEAAAAKTRVGDAQSLPRQPLAESKNMSREYGGQWLSSTTRHIRIYAAYIDPETNAFDQTQMDKLTLILDPQEEFVWTDETCQMVYNEFQDLVDHYEGAELSEYTLRLIGSDLEHYIRKLLYDGVIKYNMLTQNLNFSMGKPRVKFNSSQIPDAK